MKSRLVFTAFNRPFYFRPVLESWRQVRGLPDWAPTVFLEPSHAAPEMTDLAQAAGLRVQPNTTRHGVLHNPWVALDTAFGQGAEFVVLAEDDVIVSDDVLEYMTWAATALAYTRTLTVCAASFAASINPGQEHSVVASAQFCPLIWGTWAQRWDTVLRESWDHDYGSGQATDTPSGWDWNLNLRVIPAGGWQVVAPLASRSDHIGEFMGSHTTAVSYPTSRAPTFRAHRPAGCFQPVVR